MLGKSVFRLISYAVAGAVAITLGSTLLSSVSSVVISFRFGNSFPLILVLAGTASLLLISKRITGTLPKMILDILSWIANAYLSVIVFFVLLPFGLIIGIMGLAITITVVATIKDTKGLGEKVSQLLDQTSILGSQIPLIGPSISGEQTSWWNSLERVQLKAYLVPRLHRTRLVEILRERPYLPISITRYGDVDVLYVHFEFEPKIAEQIPIILSDLGVQDIQELSPFMTRALLTLPLIEDRESGKALVDYRVATAEQTVNRLIEIWPDRITIMPHKTGPIALVRSESAPGFEMNPLPRGREFSILLSHETEHIEIGDVPIAAESAT